MLPVDSVCVVGSDASAANGLRAAGLPVESIIKTGEAHLMVVGSAADHPNLKQRLNSAGYTKVFEHFYFPTQCSSAVRQELVRSLFSYIESSYESYVNPARNIACYETLFDLASSRRAGTSLDVLDFGCGTGMIQSTTVPRSARSVVGYDFSEPMRRGAEKHGLIVIDSLDEPAVNQFDAILAAFVLHLGIGTAAVEKLVGLLRPGGVLAANFHKDMFLVDTVEEIRRHAGNRVTIDLCKTTFGTAVIAQRSHGRDV